MKTEKQPNRSIKAKHQEDALSISETKPSEVTDSFWVYAKRKKGRYPKSTPRSGKWLIFVNLKNVNDVWAKIKNAAEEGRLGDSAKVATAKKSIS